MTDGGQLMVLDTVQHRHLDVVDFLINEPWFQQHHVKQLVSYAIDNGKEDILSVLMRHDSSKKWRGVALMKACRGPNATILKFLLRSDSNLSSNLINLLTEIALEDGCEEIQLLLLRIWLGIGDKQNSVKEALGFKKNYLVHVLSKGYEQSAALLISLGADVKERGINGSTALHVAAGLGNQNLVDRIITLGADVLARDDFGNTAFHEASKRGHCGVLEHMFKSINHRVPVNNRGESLLHIAASNGHKSTVQLLCKHRASMSDCSLDEYNTLELAIRNKFEWEARN